MDYWNIKDWSSYHIIQRVDIKPWKTQKTKSGSIALFRDQFGVTYSSRTIRTWEELTPDQKSRAYRDAYERRRADALWQVQKDPSLSEQYPEWLQQLKKERDEAIEAINNGKHIEPPRHSWE